MSRALSRLDDTLLGCFSRLPQSKTLDHLLRYLGTWSGSDKFFMIIQYGVKVLIPLLHLGARLQHRAGLRKGTTSSTAHALSKLASIISDSRMLWRIWGLLPIIQWLISLERNPPVTRKSLNIERLQGWSMLFYYPMEHFYYLAEHKIIPTSFKNPLSQERKPLSIDTNQVGLWSSRFWAIYVLLQFAHLREDRKLLLQKLKSLRKGKGTAPTLVEKQELGRQLDAFWNEVAVNVGYLPLTAHWSLPNGLFSNDIWVGAFGLLAGLASFRAGWKATAEPPELTVEESDKDIQ